MERRRLGRTGHESSVAVLGGAACWDATVDAAGEWLQSALDHGVNHLDIAPQYGAAESVVGPHLASHRDELFIAGKTLRANPAGVTEQFGTDAAPAQRRGARPLPGARGHHRGGARPALARARADPQVPRCRPDAFRRHHRPRSRGAAGAPRGAAPLRPRYGDVPGLPGPVGPARVPRAGRGAPGPLRRARRRRHGHQGGGAAALGRPAPAGRRGRRRPRHRRPLGRIVVRARRHRRPDRPWRALRALHPGRPRVLHPGRHGHASRGARLGRALRADGRRGASRAAVDAMAAEELIFPMPR